MAAPFAPIRVQRNAETKRKGTPHGPPAPPSRSQPARPPCPHARGVVGRRLAASLGRRAAEAAAEDAERVEMALGLLGERFQEGRSGIVLEQVAGGWAFRASREAAEACGRMFERPVERGLSQAAMETLAVIAYLGPRSRPEIARLRGVAADSVVAGLVERGVDRRGRTRGRWRVRHRTTPLFERVFGLESLSVLPRLDRPRRRRGHQGRLESLAEKRPA